MSDGLNMGERDLEHAVAELASRLPPQLDALARLAYNYRWSWQPGGYDLFRSVDPHRWRLCGENPVQLLLDAGAGALARAATDESLLRRAAALEAVVRAEVGRPRRPGPCEPERPIAFFCAEYAVHPSLPVYSGGLGALAGDFLKEASDRLLPVVAVGLMYRQGYFRQRVDARGGQHEYWVETDPERLPAALVTGPDGAPVTIDVPVGPRGITVQIWRVDVGGVPLFLLDAERPENDAIGRWSTARLYCADPGSRLAQYALLGIGGMRALAALGIEPALIHLNEGHAALAFLEAAAQAARGKQPASGRELARLRTVFTTHTPLPAGNDTYPAAQVTGLLGRCAAELGIDCDSLISLGRTRPDDGSEPFGLTQFALRTSRVANGVSRRHGEVAREMWRELWPGKPVETVPITHVTNGVHLPTWLGAPMRTLLDRHLGSGWPEATADPDNWNAIEAIPAVELWKARSEQRAALIDYVRERSVVDRLSRDDPYEYVLAAERVFDPDVLTIGFARRLATYKRLHLLLFDSERVAGLLSGAAPIQFVLAGKAHPKDEEAKDLLRGLFAAKGLPHAGERVVYLEDYDLRLAARLVQGCDVWVNVPRPPLEACGTSGMKAAVNGCLNLSVLDGWWAEAYDGANGWALSGEVDADHRAQDARDSAELYRLLAEVVTPAFYDRDASGLPQAWLACVRRSLRSLAPAFSTARMLADYEERIYPPGPHAAR